MTCVHCRFYVQTLIQSLRLEYRSWFWFKTARSVYKLISSACGIVCCCVSLLKKTDEISRSGPLWPYAKCNSKRGWSLEALCPQNSEKLQYKNTNNIKEKNYHPGNPKIPKDAKRPIARYNGEMERSATDEWYKNFGKCKWCSHWMKTYELAEKQQLLCYSLIR